MKEDIQTLRKRLNELDSELLAKVAERQRIVAEIGREKAARGVGTRDYQREREVLTRARELAAGQGLSERFAEQLFRQLIETSLERQEADRVASVQLGGQPALVLGGAGKMGAWFVNFLASQGFRVEIADPSAASDPRNNDRWTHQIERFAMIVLATPIATTAKLLEELARLQPAALIFDLSSLKTPLQAQLKAMARAGLKVCSIHPMFGPDTTLLSERHVLLLDAGNREALAEARTLFAPTMATMVEMPLAEHDRLMAYVLGLSHALNIAFFTVLTESGETASQLASMSSTTFDAQLDIAGQVASENPDLYFEIQALNPHRRAALDAMEEALARIKRLVDEGDSEQFARLMRAGNDYLARRSGAAVTAPGGLTLQT